MKPSTRLFRALLALYPGEFRDEYGREVTMVFADRYRAARGAGERARVWADAIVGVLREAPKEHVRVLLQDLRYAWRVARRSPAFTATAVTTLALGIGANTAIFQLIETVAFRPLPVVRPHDLAEVRIVGGNRGFGVNPGRYTQLTRPMWQEIREHQQAFAGVFAWAQVSLRVGELASSQPVNGLVVTGAFFDVLGVRAARGRLIEAADERVPCPASTAVVSHDYWQRQLGGRDLGAVRLTVEGRPHEVVGVVEPTFSGLAVGERFDLVVPFCEPRELRRELFNISVIGRLRPGWTIDRASAHLGALSAGIMDATTPAGYSAQSTATYRDFRLGAYPVAQGVSALRTTYGTSLHLLLALTGLVLLIACANLANLMLARASGRHREVAVRLAIGASRTRLFRQFIAESAMFAALGAIGGVVIARVLSEALVWGLETRTSRITLALDVNWRVLAFSAAVAAATCVLFGLAPAVRAMRTRPADVLRGGGRAMTDAGRFSLQRLMVVLQVAVSLVLLAAAVMFGRSFRNLSTFDPGLRVDGVAVLYMGYPALNGPPERLTEIQRQLLDEIRGVPGVIEAAATSNLPLIGGSWSHSVQIESATFSTKFTWVSPTYFATLGIPIVEGRGLSDLDTRASTPVAVVNHAFVRALGVAGSPLARTMRTGSEPNFPSTVYQIVGVIPDTQYNDLKSPTPPMVFAPQTQYPPLGPWSTVMVHASADPAAIVRLVKQKFLETRPEVVLEGIVFKERIRDSMHRERLLAALAGFLGVLASVLAMVGLYGMVSYAVAQRRQELGIRVALGADRHDVVSMMMREASRLVIVGVVLGTGLALLAGPAAATLLFGLAPRDPVTLAAAATLMAMVASAATFLPARAAARLDPLQAMRDE